MADFALLLKEYSDINAQIKALEKEKDMMKTNILIELKMANVNSLETETHSVKYSMVQRKVLDKKQLNLFLEEYQKNYDSFLVISEYEQLKVESKNPEES